MLPHISRMTACALPRFSDPKNGSLTQHNRQEIPVSPFVLVMRNGTTRHAPASPHCLAGNIARLPVPLPRCRQPASTQATLPDLSVLNAELTRPSAARPSADAQVLPALTIVFAQRITSLSQGTGRDQCRMRTSSDATSFAATEVADFGGPNVEASVTHRH